MTIIRVKGFKIFRDRHGHPRCYHRKTGVRVDLQKAPLGSAGFFAACAKIAAANTKKKKIEIEAPRSLGLLICEYRASPTLRRRSMTPLARSSMTRNVDSGSAAAQGGRTRSYTRDQSGDSARQDHSCGTRYADVDTDHSWYSIANVVGCGQSPNGDDAQRGVGRNFETIDT
jgi:hypothetical protein